MRNTTLFTLRSPRNEETPVLGCENITEEVIHSNEGNPLLYFHFFLLYYCYSKGTRVISKNLKCFNNSFLSRSSFYSMFCISVAAINAFTGSNVNNGKPYEQ